MKTVNDIERAGRETWLAGIGASSKGMQHATEAFDKAYSDTNSLINELIERGEKVDAKLREKFNVKAFVEQKIIKLRAAAGLDKPSKEEQLDILSEKVDALLDTVSQLASKRKAVKVEKIVAEKAPKAPAKKAAAPKVTAAKPKAKKSTSAE